MAGRVTIQDIADALGVSRNTVSKAINNTGVLADATRDKILKKAVEMGYKQFSYINLEDFRPTAPADSRSSAAETRQIGVITLLTTTAIDNSHFSSTMLDKIHRELSRAGYSLNMFRISKEETAACRLPESFSPEKTDAIICIEVFDFAYSSFLAELDIPVLFVDGPAPCPGKKLYADMLLMNNRTEIHSFMAEMYRRGKRSFGFVGETMHCMSFWERFEAMKEALQIFGLPYDESCSITALDPDSGIDSGEAYQDYLEGELAKMPRLPEVFVCANDFVAYDLLMACKRRGLTVPKDFLLCGFDDSPESRVMTPTLTTIHIHSQIMGYSAAQLLLTRLENPNLHYRTVYTETSLMYRESTNG